MTEVRRFVAQKIRMMNREKRDAARKTARGQSLTAKEHRRLTRTDRQVQAIAFNQARRRFGPDRVPRRF